MHTKIFSAATIGVQAYSVEVEVDLSFGLLNFMIVGLADTAIKESRQRIATALKNCGVRLPERKITINLAPADLKKEGTLFDLPIAIGILVAAGQLEIAPQVLATMLMLGELSLDGTIRSVKGVLPIACDALRLGKKRLIVPKENAHEAALIEGLEVIGVSHLIELVSFLRGELVIEPTKASFEQFVRNSFSDVADFSEVVGQKQAKRALQIAAAGYHNILFIGSPGSGKTMLARRIVSILPPLSFTEALETSKIYSVCGKLAEKRLVVQRPFRAPHHTTSQVGLVGGGSFPQPGEISLAHNGVLFLDELTEFKKSTLEVLRQPLESNDVTISRAQYSVSFPANFLLVTALNPCPCGYLGDQNKKCTCSSQQVAKYLDKLSGPLLDRIDLQVSVPAVDYATVLSMHQKTSHGSSPDRCSPQAGHTQAGSAQADSAQAGPVTAGLLPRGSHVISSAQLRDGVARARERQKERFGVETMFNAHMSPDLIQRFCPLDPAAEELVKKAFERLHLSMRGYHKLLKVARTIADIDGSDDITAVHVQEAIMYRSLEQTLEREK